MKLKKILQRAGSIALAFTIFLSSMVMAAAEMHGQMLQNELLVSELIDIMPFLLLNQGSSNSINQFSDGPFVLDSANGGYVNFWIHNHGTHTVRATISGVNGLLPRDFAPVESGHITGDIVTANQSVSFRVVSVQGGANVNIDFRIAQRHLQ